MSGARAWLVAALSVVLGALLTVGWGEFVWHRTGDFQDPLPAGQAWTQKDGSTLRITKWEVTQTVHDEDKKAFPARTGTSWVHIVVAVTGRTADTSCGFDLAGRGSERWGDLGIGENPIFANPSYCPDDAPANLDVELAYLVPNTKLPEVRGLAIDHSMMLRQPPILTPPA